MIRIRKAQSHAFVAAILVAAAMAGFATAYMLASSTDRRQIPVCSEACAPTALTAPPASQLSVSRPRPQR